MSADRAIAVLAGLLLILSASACSRFQSDYQSGHRAIDGVALTRLQDIADVLVVLGPPTRLGRAGAGTAFMYEDVTIRETQFGINISYDWLSIFKFVFAKGDAEIETVEIVFDENGDVVSHSNSNERRTIGYGGSFDLIFNAVPVIDSRNYTDLAPQHDWGNGLSQSVPVMLNAPYSVRQGVGGVERVSTPDEIGQETLGQPR